MIGSLIDVLWGLKTVAVFDVWSLEHFMAGMSVGGFIQAASNRVFRDIPVLEGRQDIAWWSDLSACLFLAYLWEAIEHYLENGTAGVAVEYWFQGIEFWANRLIADPALLVLGMALVRRHPWLAWPTRGASMIWLGIHVFVFPHCMYLYELFDIA